MFETRHVQWRNKRARILDIQRCLCRNAILGEVRVDGGAQNRAIDEDIERDRLRRVLQEVVDESGDLRSLPCYILLLALATMTAWVTEDGDLHVWASSTGESSSLILGSRVLSRIGTLISARASMVVRGCVRYVVAIPKFCWSSKLFAFGLARGHVGVGKPRPARARHPV